MASHHVHVQRTITTEVMVEAETPEAAVSSVSHSDFPLPPYDQWEIIDGWRFVVYDPDSGMPVYEEE